MNPKRHLTTVLETLLGDNPYNEDYPRDLIVTFERDQNGRIRRVHFSLYGEGDSANYRGELRNPRLEDVEFSPPDYAPSSLSIRRPRDRMTIDIISDRIMNAFTEIARQELAKQRGNQNSRRTSDDSQ